MFFKDDRRTFKDTRAIYARITYEAFFCHDPRWKNVDEDVFFSEILGHDDENTQLHYKQFKLHNFSRSWRPKTGIENKRLAALQALDDQMPGFARGDAGVRIHETTKRLVEESANIVINTKILRDAGFNPTLVRRYLDFVAEPLGQTVGENGWLQADEAQPSIILNLDDDLEDDEADDDHSYESEVTTETGKKIALDETSKDTTSELKTRASTAATAERPRFEAPRKNDDGMWVVRYEYKGVKFAWAGDADNIRDAMQKAWHAYN
jgi:hypothetical protein